MQRLFSESGSESLWKPTIKKNDLWNKGKLKEHYYKHGIPEFGAKSSKEYSEMAYEFGNRSSDSIIEVVEGHMYIDMNHQLIIFL